MRGKLSGTKARDEVYWCVHDFQCLMSVIRGWRGEGYHCHTYCSCNCSHGLTANVFYWFFLCISQLYTECGIQAARDCNRSENLLHGEGSYVVFKLCSELNIFVPVRLVCEPAKWLPLPR